MVPVREPSEGRLGAVVLGMSRSGTSAVTAAFVKAGYFVGEASELMAPNRGNPTGYFENLRIYRVNERVLEALGGSWLVAPPRASQQAAARWAVPTLQAELDRLIREAGSRPIVIKDPRIGLLLPLWGCAFQNRFQPVLVVRHPVEIARSLGVRDGSEIRDGVLAWEAHMREVISYLSEHEVVVAPYDRLTERPESTTQVVESVSLGLDPARSGGLRPTTAQEAIDGGLRHQSVTAGREDAPLDQPQADLWRWLASLPLGLQRLSPPSGLLGRG